MLFRQRVRFPSDTHECQRVQDSIVDQLLAANFPEKAVFGIKLALEEALINAVKHGNQLDRDKQVEVRYTIEGDSFLIEIEDEGPGFNCEDVPDPTSPENLERPCGRGLLLMRAYMTECNFLRPAISAECAAT